MNPELLELIAAQTGREQLASHTYKSLALWCAAAGFAGSQGFFEATAKEEIEHRDKQLAFLNDYCDSLPPVPAATEELLQPSTLLDAFIAALTLEIEVTAALRGISAKADELGAHEVEAFYVWFLNEQIDSVSTLRTIVRQLTFAGDNPAAVLAIDALIGEQND